MVKRENQHMAHRRIVIGITIALLSVVVTGCAGPTTETRVVSTDPAASSSSAAGLNGTWHGSFDHPGADYTSPPGNTNLTLQVRADSTYTFKWGNRPQTTGTIAAHGNRVYLDDSSGSQITLVQSGNTLYGVMKDSGRPGAGHYTAKISLQKVEATVDRSAATHPTWRSRLCEAAGGAYSHGRCEPITTPDWRARCEARGGTYFMVGEFCEVPAGGLRPT
jgi:hypothetical protein